MKRALLVACLSVLGACRPPAHVAMGDKGLPVITAAPDASFKDVRDTLAEVAVKHPRAFLHLEAAPDADLVELSADDNDDLDALLVVRVTKYATFVGGHSSATDQDIMNATGVMGGSARFAVVRAEDDARVVDVVRAARLVNAAGVTHTILSRRAPSARTEARSLGGSVPRLTCAWPSRAPRVPAAAAKARVEVTRDDVSGVGVVRVVAAPPGGFRQAAAFCASTAELPSSSQGHIIALEIEFEVGNVFQCAEPGDDRMAQGAYTPNEVNSTYGTLPSQGCDRFPR